MSFANPALAAGYAVGNSTGISDDKDGPGSAFEFTRRKRWPQLLLQELVGSALFCLRPIPASGSWSWRIVYATPSTGEMLGRKPADLEGTDFTDLILAIDQSPVTNLFSSLLLPAPISSTTTTPMTEPTPTPTQSTPPASLGKSQTVYARINLADRTPGSIGSGIAAHGAAPLVWELRAHATGLEGAPAVFSPGGAGTVVPHSSDDTRGRAVWVMGRKVDGVLESDQKSLETFLELKLENERLREELKELQVDYDEDDLGGNGYLANPYQGESDSEMDSDDSTIASSSSSFPATKRKPKASRDRAADPGSAGAGGSSGLGGGEKEKKRKRNSLAVPAASGAGVPAAAEGMHVCVTCGRTDSPEWRKGPLGPKTLCNACGLRWAKRNSTNAGKKDRKEKK